MERLVEDIWKLIWCGGCIVSVWISVTTLPTPTGLLWSVPWSTAAICVVRNERIGTSM